MVEVVEFGKEFEVGEEGRLRESHCFGERD